MRPSSRSPTGTRSGCPRSATGSPRARPAVGVSAIARTTSEATWAATSRTISPSRPARSSPPRWGRCGQKRASTTLPRTESTCPSPLGGVDLEASAISNAYSPAPAVAGTENSRIPALGLRIRGRLRDRRLARLPWGPPHFVARFRRLSRPRSALGSAGFPPGRTPHPAAQAPAAASTRGPTVRPVAPRQTETPRSSEGATGP